MYTKVEKVVEALYNYRNFWGNILYKIKGGKYLIRRENHNNIIHIIANGPSYAKTEHLIDLIPGDCMCMNFAINKDLVLKHSPKFVCWCDPDFFKDEYKLQRQEVLDYCKKNKAKFYVPFKYIKGSDLEQNPNVISINSIAKKGEIYTARTKRRYEKNKEVPAFQTVAIMAIYVAIQLGYRTIYLHGVDEDQIKRLEMVRGELYTEYYHCYEESKREKLNYTMFQMTKSYLTLLEGFKKIADYARDEKINIINMNENSNIEFFDFYDGNGM